MIKKSLAVAVILLFIGMCVVPSTAVQEFREKPSPISFDGNTLYVGGTGEGNFTKIQDAIDNASDEDTILIYNKTYYERINVNKKLTIRGLLSEDDDKPTIDGQKRGAIVNIQSNNCHIENIVVKNAGQNFSPTRAGFIISAKYSYIINCNISGFCYTGIYIMPENKADDSRIVSNAIDGNMIQGIYMPYHPMGGSDRIFISGNSIYGVGYSIYLWAGRDNTINENKIWSNSYGILIRVGGDTDIIENNITDNDQYGISIEITDYNNYYHNIERNNICYNAGTGIKISSAYYVTIHGNTISNNRNSGISVDHFTKSDIEFNNIESNGEYGIALSQSSNNNYINGNNIKECKEGIVVHYSSKNVISKNSLIHNERGIILRYSTETEITDNTFIRNRYSQIFAYYIGNKETSNNTWNGNYWNRPRIFPKPIFGLNGLKPEIDFDKHPASEPYDIGV